MSNPGDYYGMATKIEELEAEKKGYEEQWIKFEEEIERLRESEEFFSGKCCDAELKILELEAKVDRVKGAVDSYDNEHGWMQLVGDVRSALIGKENDDV